MNKSSPSRLLYLVIYGNRKEHFNASRRRLWANESTLYLMFVLSIDQIEVFEKPEGDPGFDEKVMVHLQHFFPEQCYLLGQRRLKQVIRYGKRKARQYGFTTRPTICQYVDLMFVFGLDFDQDSSLDWAKEILEGSVKKSASFRMRELNLAANQHRELATGL